MGMDGRIWSQGITTRVRVHLMNNALAISDVADLGGGPERSGKDTALAAVANPSFGAAPSA
jgi:hypothetical protein